MVAPEATWFPVNREEESIEQNGNKNKVSAATYKPLRLAELEGKTFEIDVCLSTLTLG